MARGLSYRYEHSFRSGPVPMLTLPQTATYALRAVYAIAEAPAEDLVQVETIADELKVPRNYLSKTLHQLVRAGVLRSTRGPHGGFRLGKPADELTLAEVVRPFLPPEGKTCVLGRGTCSEVSPCAAHDRWKAVAGELRTFFGGTTVRDLLDGEAAHRRSRSRKKRAG